MEGKRKAKLESEFRKHTSHASELDHLLLSKHNLLESLKKRLQERKNDEEEMYGVDVRFNNFLTYILLGTGELREAEQENKAAIAQDPKSILALLLKAYICLKQDLFDECESVLMEVKQLKSGADQEELEVIVQAELAYCLYKIGPQYYPENKKRLEAYFADVVSIIMENPHATPEQVLSQVQFKLSLHHLMFWSLDVLRVNNRLLVTSNFSQEHLQEIDLEELLRQSKALTLFVTTNSPEFAGNAWIELADTYRKYKFCPPKYLRTETLPAEAPTENDCIYKALECSPDDPYVLERAGRHFRLQAGSIQEFEKAIEYLKKAVSISPTHHVCWHHMMLSYKAIYALEHDLPEASLYKKGYGTSQTGRGRGRGGRGRGRGQGRAGGHFTTQNVPQQPYVNKSELKAMNSLVTGSPDSLLQALVAAEEAYNVKQSTIFDTEIARIYINMGNYKKAEEYFRKGEEDALPDDHYTISQLYEQWALLIEKQIDMALPGASKIQMIMYLREAIRWAIPIGSGADVALNRLKKIILEELEDSPGDSCLINEHRILNKAKNIREFCELLKSEKNIIHKVILEMAQNKDTIGALMYLQSLLLDGNFHLMALNIKVTAKQVMMDACRRPHEVPLYVSHKYFIHMLPGDASTNTDRNATHITLMSTSETLPTYKYITKVFPLYQLNMKTIIMDKSEDPILDTTSFLWPDQSWNTNCLMIILEGLDGEQGNIYRRNKMEHMLLSDIVSKVKTSGGVPPICCITSHSDASMPQYLSDFPVIDIQPYQEESQYGKFMAALISAL